MCAIEPGHVLVQANVDSHVLINDHGGGCSVALRGAA